MGLKTEKTYIMQGNAICMVTTPPEIVSEVIRLHREGVQKNVKIHLSTGQIVEISSQHIHITQ